MSKDIMDLVKEIQDILPPRKILFRRFDIQY